MLIYDNKNVDGALNFDCIEYFHKQEVDGAKIATWRVVAVGNTGEEYVLLRQLTEEQADMAVDELIMRYGWGDRVVNLDDVRAVVTRRTSEV